MQVHHDLTAKMPSDYWGMAWTTDSALVVIEKKVYAGFFVL